MKSLNSQLEELHNDLGGEINRVEGDMLLQVGEGSEKITSLRDEMGNGIRNLVDQFKEIQLILEQKQETKQEGATGDVYKYMNKIQNSLMANQKDLENY